MQQVIIDFGQVHLFGHELGVRIYGYGLMLVLGFLCGITLARWRARRFGENPDVVTSVGLLALLGGVIGARLAFVIEKWDTQFAHLRDPLPEILNITSGGLIYYGGVALASITIIAYLLIRRLPVRRYLDIIAPSLMIGLAFGRAGCLVNGCCYGGPARPDFPLAMTFPYAAKPLVHLGAGNAYGGASVSPVFAHQVNVTPARGGLAGEVPEWLFRGERGGLKSPSELTGQQVAEAAHLHSRPVQPAQVYGILNALLIAGLLLAFSRLRRAEGQVFALMLILPAVGRFMEEIIRGDNPHDVLRLVLTHNQYSSLGLMFIGILLWLALRLLPGSAGPFWNERLAVAEIQSAPPKQRKGRS